jgi:hypothetical protein
MGESRSARVTMLMALVMALALAGTAVFTASGATEAKKTKAEGLVACPGKVGKHQLARVDVGRDGREQLYSYTHPKRFGAGSVSLRVWWHPDVAGERERCLSREPGYAPYEETDDRLWWTASRVSKVEGWFHPIHEPGVSPGKAEGPLRQLIKAAESLAHRCVPDIAATVEEGLACPLRLPGDLIRSDWYEGSPQVIGSLGDPAKQSYDLHCIYVPAYTEDGDAVSVRVIWREGDPTGGSTCIPRVKHSESAVDPKYDTTSTRLGYHPVGVEISDGFAASSLGREFADGLAAAAAARTQRCPSAPDGPAPYEESAATGSPDASATTIVLSGGPADEPPAIGTTIELPPDDQHQLTVGGPDGEVIRDEFIGDQAMISGYGPIVSDADGNWSVLVSVDVSTAPAPQATVAPTVAPEPVVTLAPSPAPATSPAAPSPDSIAVPPDPPPPEPAESPMAAPPPVSGPTASPTPVPPPELIGVPPGIAAIVAKLPPAGAGAVRDVSDHVAILGELLETEQGGTVTVPASDIGSLRELMPGLVQEVWLTDGSIVVSTTNSDIGSILVKPIIGDDGLISVKLNDYQLVTFHPVVRALVAALNGYVAERGGRFTEVSVTPEGLTVSAERKAGE